MFGQRPLPRRIGSSLFFEVKWAWRIMVGLLLVQGLAGTGSAQTAIFWSSTVDGNWTSHGNWTGNAPPANNTTANYASFNQATGVTVTIDANRSVAGIEFGASAGAYTISKTSNPGRTLTVGAYGIRSLSSSDQVITGAFLS